MIICLCEGLSDRDLREVVRNGATSRFELSMRTGAGRCCGSCRCDLKQIVQEETEAMVPEGEVVLPLAAK